MKLLTKEMILKQGKSAEFDCVVYFLIKDNEIVYVGSSAKGLSRAYGHKGKGRRRKDYDHSSYIHVQKDLLQETELRYIIKFKPKYNQTFPKSDKYKSPIELGKFFGIAWEKVIKICEKYNVKIHKLNEARPEYVRRVVIINSIRFAEAIAQEKV